MEISTLMLILILVVAVLFSFLCGILTERHSYVDDDIKQHTMRVTFYTTGSKYSIGDRLVFVTKK